MDWAQFLLLFITVAGLIYSIKSDAKEDRNRSYEDRKEIINIMRNFEKGSKEFQQQVAKETKEFHGRLCTLEERYLQIITERK